MADDIYRERARLAEQAAAEEWLADQADDWPDGDPRRYMLRRGRWIPIDTVADIATYQAVQATAPGQN